ncbi:N-acetylglucosamine kinase [Glaesserella sp.]|uniref:N-acetylglucosamine kinase n=1 Tax=Glaesserella sp. TaxID=2094731 RepID=UPI00359FFFA9
MAFYYGLDIGGTKIELAVFNEKLDKLYTERVPTPQTSYEDWLNTVETLVRNADAKFGEEGKVGLGVPGFVNHKSGLAEMANIAVVHGKPLLNDLTVRLGREVRAENDANCLALSEAWDASNLQYETVLGFIIGTGFGGGIVLNGKAHSGQIGMAGEVGHLKLDYQALKLLGWDKAPVYKCGCGQTACWDSYISGRGFEFLYRDLVGEQIDAKTIIQRFYDKDPKTVEFVERYIQLMAIAVAGYITVLDPDMIVFGGGLSNFDYIYEALPKALPPYLMRNAEVPVIKKAIHGDSSGVRGAAALFLDK